MSRIRKKITKLEKVAEILKQHQKPMNYEMLEQKGFKRVTLLYCIPELEKRGEVRSLPDWEDLRRNYYQWSSVNK